MKRVSLAIALGIFVQCQVLAGPKCKAGMGYSAVDMSGPVNDSFLDNAKRIGISTIIRYYDWEDETLPNKTLKQSELKSIAERGLNVAVVFQHHNDSTTTFETVGRGKIDGKRSVYLAKSFSQPAGSAVYFGVDGIDAKFFEKFRKIKTTNEEKYGIDVVKRYFREVNSVFSGTGYKIGVYGSGLVCRSILDAGLAQYCWLANATGWPEYREFEKSNRWQLKQLLPTKARDCFGVEVDLDVVGHHGQTFGQWSPTRPRENDSK